MNILGAIEMYYKTLYTSTTNTRSNDFKDFTKSYLIEGNGYETRQSSLLCVFVLLFDLEPAQNTILSCLLRTAEELPNRNVLIT